MELVGIGVVIAVVSFTLGLLLDRALRAQRSPVRKASLAYQRELDRRTVALIELGKCPYIAERMAASEMSEEAEAALKALKECGV